MMLSLSDYYYATVAYADIFIYPLTVDDVYFWFIKTIPKQNIHQRQVRGITRVGNMIFLKGRRSIITRQKNRQHYSRNKLRIARSVAGLFKFIPTIKLVGITGGLAMRNAGKTDDIDIFIITAAKTIWITRLLTVILLDIFGKRRKPGQVHVADKICLNMFMSENELRLPKTEQDLFAAHEVLQMEPLWSRGDIYRKFLIQNNWVKYFLPVAWNIKQNGLNFHPKNSHWWTYVGIFFLRLSEHPARLFQLWYMHKRRTVESVSSEVIRFHPRDARVWVKKELWLRLAKINIPLDNIFYAR